MLTVLVLWYIHSRDLIWYSQWQLWYVWEKKVITWRNLSNQIWIFMFYNHPAQPSKGYTEAHVTCQSSQNRDYNPRSHHCMIWTFFFHGWPDIATLVWRRLQDVIVWYGHFFMVQADPILTLPMLRLLSSIKATNAKIFENHLNPVMLVFIGNPSLSNHMPGFQSFSGFLRHFVLAILASSNIRVNTMMRRFLKTI